MGLLSKLFYFSNSVTKTADKHVAITSENRDWERMYRNRWQHDKVVRSTHGVNCTGSCSWKIFVTNGLVTWETQQTDYPRTRPGMPNHEPRGCPRGASYSWYLYSANRVKYPMIRGELMTAYKEAKARLSDPIKAWEAVVSDLKNMPDAGEKPEWKPVLLDELSGNYVVPNGTIGSRWEKKQKWNLELKDSKTGTDIVPQLSLFEKHDEVIYVQFPYFGGSTFKHEHFSASNHDDIIERKVPVRKIKTIRGEIYTCTVFDLMVANYGIDRGFDDPDSAKSYDEDLPFTPKWQEKITGVPAQHIISTARQFAENAATTEGKSMIIIGAGVNHWYHTSEEYVVSQLKNGQLNIASEDSDNPANFPRNLFVWRSNLLGSSAKGMEYFMKHLLGAQNSVQGNDLKELGQTLPSEVKSHDEAPEGKLDLLVTLDFRMSTTGLHSDILLPAASWYEKNDLSTSDNWENQEKWKGGWMLDKSKLRPRMGNKTGIMKNIFSNPHLPQIDDYYEPFTFNYSVLHSSAKFATPPSARPHSMLTGLPMEKIEKGPNWEDNLGGAFEERSKEKNFEDIDKQIYSKFENAFMMYLPRLCEHCLNPTCVAACPSGAIYKREDDGIVLIDQDRCRGWRQCVSACPYKKIYFNWKTKRSEKCTLCYPKIENGEPTICSETCVGRIRYGVMLYDTEKIKESASTENPVDLYQSHLDIFLDPNNPEIAEEARKQRIPDNFITAAQNSPVYKMAVEWKVAFPLHPEYRTLPMVWYTPPLSPIQEEVESGKLGFNGIIPDVDMLRIPIKYLANMFTAGDESPVREALVKMLAMRAFMKC